jgi:hypothetical protein
MTMGTATKGNRWAHHHGVTYRYRLKSNVIVPHFPHPIEEYATMEPYRPCSLPADDDEKDENTRIQPPCALNVLAQSADKCLQATDGILLRYDS